MGRSLPAYIMVKLRCENKINIRKLITCKNDSNNIGVLRPEPLASNFTANE